MGGPDFLTLHYAEARFRMIKGVWSKPLRHSESNQL